MPVGDSVRAALAIRVARGACTVNRAVGGWISWGSVSGRLKLRERWGKAYTRFCIAPRLLRLAGDAKWELSRQSLSSRTEVLIASKLMMSGPSCPLETPR